MLTISNKVLEKAFNRPVKKHVVCLGVDTASRTGWCKVKTNDTESVFDYGVIAVDSTSTYYKYNQFIEIFNKIIEQDNVVVIEESYCGINIKTFQLLSRLGAYVYAIAFFKGVKDKRFTLATTARKFLGFKGNLNKKKIHKEFKQRLSLDLIYIDDEDVIDAFILALNGILEDSENE